MPVLLGEGAMGTILFFIVFFVNYFPPSIALKVSVMVFD
jgi:hypothetical protein